MWTNCQNNTSKTKKRTYMWHPFNLCKLLQFFAYFRVTILGTTLTDLTVLSTLIYLPLYVSTN